MIFSRARPEFHIEQAKREDLSDISKLHALCFSRGWSTAELQDMHQREGLFFWVARQVGKPDVPPAGFNIVRQTPYEAEILSVGVAPDFRGNNVGHDLMRHAINHLIADRVPSLFLEVDETNQAAISLYNKLGFQTVGQRPAYYVGEGAQGGQVGAQERTSALVMRLDLV